MDECSCAGEDREAADRRTLPAGSRPRTHRFADERRALGYGTGWGAVYGLLQGTLRINPLAHGLAFGTGVWAMSYVQLVPTGLYEPPWEYPAKSLAKDLSYHLVYGVGVAAAYQLLDSDG